MAKNCEEELLGLARGGHLDVDSKLWGRQVRKEILASIALKEGFLPPGFRQWHLQVKQGRTLAHIAPYYQPLPSDFEDWHWVDDKGWTVAHHAALNGYLPYTFSDWHWIDNNDWTVAHFAVKKHQLPASFQNWHWQTKKEGITVAYLAILWNRLPDYCIA